MTNHCTAEEKKEIYIKFMGELDGKVFSALWQEVAMLYNIWGEYVDLFGSGQDRIDLMNKAAPCFFRTVQVSFFRDTILRIARLTDPKEVSSKKNLSINYFEKEVRENINGLEDSIGRANTAAKICKDHRNRSIAHADLTLAIDGGATPLEPVTRKIIADALSSIAEVLNLILDYYNLEITTFENCIRRGDGADLLRIVKKSIRRS